MNSFHRMYQNILRFTWLNKQKKINFNAYNAYNDVTIHCMFRTYLYSLA